MIHQFVLHPMESKQSQGRPPVGIAWSNVGALPEAMQGLQGKGRVLCYSGNWAAMRSYEPFWHEVPRGLISY